IIMDMDNFKRINNLLGYEVGNKVLKRFAQLLRNLTIDRSISVSRFGSDEFAIILPGVSKDQAFSIAGKIHKAVEDPTFIAPNSGVHVSVSFGISSLRDDSSSKNDLIDNALHALSLDKARVIR
ncbi:diguanylate cyclase, partial [Candidatus Poribacteria bacterium]|nr:diguanylate cyclase [Candidatus Poribacteria bacterium]